MLNLENSEKKKVVFSIWKKKNKFYKKILEMKTKRERFFFTDEGIVYFYNSFVIEKISFLNKIP